MKSYRIYFLLIIMLIISTNAFSQQDKESLYLRKNGKTLLFVASNPGPEIGSSTGKLTFWCGGGVGYTTLFSGGLYAKDKVTIGSLSYQSTTAKLIVKGNSLIEGKIIANEVEIKQNVWADFVFKENYKLKSLYDLEEFINENGHLPDIPSEEEVKKDGISVGEINAKLLQKVEELTLYMIEQNKKMDLQSEEISKLKLELQEVKQRR